MSDELRMRAYYYGFEPTGCRSIDVILSAVACAGKAYHHTNSWCDETPKYEEVFRGECPVDWIYHAAEDAAAELQALRADLAASQAEVGLLLGFLHRAFGQLDELAGEGMSFHGHEDPAGILFDYARAIEKPDADIREIMADLASRALAPAP